ncbi:dermonecrotic toxin domain-containing protein [Pseudomonas sp. microsymbiont 2]
MSYTPAQPEIVAHGEPYLPEPAIHAETDIFLLDSQDPYVDAYAVDSPSTLDPDPLPSIERVFAGQQVMVQTPEAFAGRKIREFLARHGIDDDPEDLILATLIVRFVKLRPGPWKAQVAHAMTLVQAALGDWQQSGIGSWSDHLAHPMTWRQSGYAVNELGPLGKSELADSQAYDAIYRRTTPQTYDASNQVDLDPQTFKDFVWETRLQAHYLAHLDRFWSDHQHNYVMQYKGGLVRAALLQRDEGSLTAQHAEIVLKSMTLHPLTSWENTSYRYFTDNLISPRYAMCELRIYGYVASDILAIRRIGGQDLVLYIPGNSSPLHGFANQGEMCDWIAHQCRDPRKRAALGSHFRACDRPDGAVFSGLDTALRGLARYPSSLDRETGLWSPSSMITLGERLPYPANHMTRLIKQRYYADAKFEIDTRGDFYAKRVAAGLEVMSNVVGALALVFPALVPVAIALGAGLLAAGVGEVIAAKRREDTEQGALRVVFGLLNALPLAGEVKSQLQATKALLEGEELTALESAQQARDQERLARIDVAEDAEGTVLGARWPTKMEVRAHRPVLDTLSPELRARMNALKATGSEGMDVQGGGRGTFRVDGKLYINLRHDVYRVQWIEHEGQFRIRSDAQPVQWGPFLRATQEGYWDLDLRLGLRGGGSALGKMRRPGAGAGLTPLPTEIEGIAQQPMLEKISVTMPMDRIEINILGRYSARLRSGSRATVCFDADAGCWRTVSDGRYVWTDKGAPEAASEPEFDEYGVYIEKPYGDEMESGSASDYERVRHALPKPVSVEHFTFPRLPFVPEQAAEIPREVGMIWVGDQAPASHLIERMKANAVTNPDHVFTLYVDVDDLQIVDAVRKAGINVQNLREQTWFNRWVAAPEGRAYRYFRNGANHNYAAASDPLRFRLVEEHGMIYMDCDDELVRPLASVSLRAMPHDVLFGRPIEWSGMNGAHYFGPNNSNFASQRGNPLLGRIVDDINARFDALPASFLSRPRPKFSFGRMDSDDEAYIDTIFNVTGPIGMGSTMRRLRPDYMSFPWGYPQIQVKAQAYDQLRKEVLDHYFPLRDVVKLGAEHSWQST